MAKSRKEALKSDSIIYRKIIEQIESDTSKITITIEDCLLLYFNGYISGSINCNQKKSIDFSGLLLELKANKRSIIMHKKLIETFPSEVTNQLKRKNQ